MTEMPPEKFDLTEMEEKLNKINDILNDSEGYYRSLVAISPDIIYRLDDEGRIISISPAIRKLGYEPDELVGTRFEDIVHPDDRAKSLDHFVERRVGERKTNNLEIRLLTKRREAFDYEINYMNVALYARGHWDVPDDKIASPEKRFICTQGVANDITERKKAYAELRQQEEYYRSIIENSSDVIFIVNKNGIINYASPSVSRILGYEAPELIGSSAFDLILPVDVARAYQDFDKAIGMKDVIIPNSFRVRHKNGSERILDGYGKNLLDNAVVAGFIMNARDVTEQVRAQEMFLKEKKFNETIVQSSPTFFVAIDGQGRTMMMNKAMLEALGYGADEIVEKDYLENFVPEADREGLAVIFQDLVQQGQSTFNSNQILAKNGSRLLVEWHCRPVYKENGAFDFFFGVGIDVTKRKMTESALWTSEELNAKLLAAIPDCVVRTDIEGRILFINDVGLKMNGYESRDIVGVPMLSLIDPQDREKARRDFLLMRDGMIGPVEYHLLMKDGKNPLFEVNGDILKDENGFPYGMVFVCRNVTERKQEEEDRHRLESQLIQARKMEAIGTLAGGIAHDFNNLLMGIQGYISLILLGMEESHPYYEKLRAVEDQVQSGADLTRQLLGFARGGRYEVKPTNLNALVAKTAAMFGRTKKEILIHEKYQKEIWSADVDRGQMEQVILNLFVNAWQAMPGGGNIFLETENVYLDETYVAPFEIKIGPYVKISVTDTGVGMDEPTKQRIFDPFFTTKEMGRGTGLGLASVYGIIKGHGGFVNVYSEKGHGSTFNIYLPVSQNKAACDNIPKQGIKKGNETILFVDDEKTIIDVSKEMLAGLGYHVLVAQNGQEALEIYAANREGIDLVILDMVMPGMGGGELYDRLKELNPRVRVILSSGYSMNGMAKSIMGKGVQSFLQKPFRLDNLSGKIREALEDK